MKVETTQCPSTDNKQNEFQPFSEILAMKKEQSTDTCYKIDEL